MKPRYTACALVIAALIGSAQAQSFELKSSDIANGQSIAPKFVLNGFGCTGQNVSPQLSWSGAPAGAKSFALMVHDPDAPTGGAGFWHWVVVNIPTTATQLPQGAGTADGQTLPAGTRQINTDFGSPGWGGPCPPQGRAAHRYIFTLYALKLDKLELPTNATASLTGFLVGVNAIGKAELSARYSR
jgi:Raf kinase inhibitor-like YbhB/YbcL family protein